MRNSSAVQQSAYQTGLAGTEAPEGRLKVAASRVAVLRAELHRLTGNLNSHANGVFGPPPPSAIDAAKEAYPGSGALDQLFNEIAMLDASLPELENEIARFSSLA